MKTRAGLLVLSGISTILAVGSKYILGAEMSGNLLFWLFIVAIGSLIAAISIK